MSRRYARLLAAVLTAVALCGCAAGPSPDPLSALPLVVRGDVADNQSCPDNATGGIVFHLRPLTSLPGFDDTHVLAETDGRLRIVQGLRWSGRPSDLVGSSLANAMRCAKDAHLRQARQESQTHFNLTGRVTDFSVSAGEPRSFRLRFRLDIWGTQYERWIIGRQFGYNAMLEDGTPESLESGLRSALLGASEDAKSWLEVIGRAWRTPGGTN